jgi:Protein of unknown function (DUF2793)
MSETANLLLPLVQAAQAQKHVTVNEALLRLDALSHLLIQSRSVAVPPPSPPGGAVYAVPTGATGAWSGRDGRLALWINGGWEFATALPGWRAWIVDEGAVAIFRSGSWAAGAVAVSPSGAALSFRVVELDHSIAAGATSVTPAIIPAGSQVFGITGGVTSALGGSATSFRVGIGPGSLDRYGSGIATGVGSWFRGLTSTPVAYYAATGLTITADGGTFGGGSLRIAVHLLELGLPRL